MLFVGCTRSTMQQCDGWTSTRECRARTDRRQSRSRRAVRTDAVCGIAAAPFTTANAMAREQQSWEHLEMTTHTFTTADETLTKYVATVLDTLINQCGQEHDAAINEILDAFDGI